MIESALLLIGKALGMLLFTILTILVVWIVFGTVACVLACGLSSCARGLGRKVSRTWAHMHHG